MRTAREHRMFHPPPLKEAISDPWVPKDMQGSGCPSNLPYHGLPAFALPFQFTSSGTRFESDQVGSFPFGYNLMETIAQVHGARRKHPAMLDRHRFIHRPADKGSMKADTAPASGRASPSIVFYDGACGICQSFASWLMGLDQAHGLSLVAYQQIDPAELPARLTPELTQQAMHLLDAQGNLFRGARAVFEALRSLPGFWGCMGTVFSNRLMSCIAEPIYRLVADHRTAISRVLGLHVCEPAPTTLQRTDSLDHDP